jgi:hypothetical protein
MNLISELINAAFRFEQVALGEGDKEHRHELKQHAADLRKMAAEHAQSMGLEPPPMREHLAA